MKLQKGSLKKLSAR